MFDKVFQDRVLACMYQVPEFNLVACQYVPCSELEGPLAQNMGAMAIDFWKKYEATITDPAFIELMRQQVAASKVRKTEVGVYVKEFKRIKDVDVKDWKFVLSRLIAFVKNQKIKSMIDQAVKKHLPNENFLEIEKAMDEIKSITAMHEVVGYDYWDESNISEREAIRREEALMKQVGIGSGIKRLDDHFYKGGFWKKELYVFLAPPKRGKSMALLFFTNSASLQGHNVAHFSCEVSKEVCSFRLDAMNSDVPINQLNERSGKVGDAVRAGIPKGKVFFFEYPTKCLTVSEIERQIRKIRVENGIIIDMVCVDYLDLLRPARFGSDKYEDQSSVGEELRALAARQIVPVLTASQINRQGANKQLINGTDVAGSFEKIMVADEIITISATDEELANGIVRLHFSQSRNSGSATFTIETDYAKGRFYKNFVEDEY